MKTTLLFLLVCWGLGLGQLAAQVPAGPWRVVGGKPVKAAWNVNPDSIRLFLACENPLTAPPSQAGIHFTVTGATLRLDAKQHLLWLAPSAPVVVLQAYRGYRLVFRHEFKAVEPLPPEVKCYVSGRRDATDMRPEEIGKYFIVTMRAIPDANFCTIMMDDARYRVAQFRATVVRAGKVGASMLINGPQGDIEELNFTDKTGGELQLDVLLVQRQNFQGEVSEAPKPLKTHFVIPSEKP